MYRQAIEPYLQPDGELLDSTKRMCVTVRTNDKLRRFVGVHVAAGKPLTASVKIKYPFGVKRIDRRIPGEAIWEILDSKTLGQPAWLRTPLRLIGGHIMPVFVGRKNTTQRNVLTEITNHRILDMLGALQLSLSLGEMLTGVLRSILWQSATDVKAVTSGP